MKYGKVPHLNGLAPDVWSDGWVPLNRICDQLNMSYGELGRAVRDGAVKKLRIGPKAILYRVA